MASAEGGEGYRGAWAFLSSPNQAIPFFRDHLTPVRLPAEARLTRLVDDLGDNDFKVREQASEELRVLGELALPALEKAKQTARDAEVRRRIAELLNRRLDWPPKQLRFLRAIFVLEQIRSEAALELLESLAGGYPEARLTREAKAALERGRKRGKAEK